MSVVLGAHMNVYLYITAYIKGIQNKNLKLITFALQQIWFMALCRLFPLTLYSQSLASAEVSHASIIIQVRSSGLTILPFSVCGLKVVLKTL